VYKTKGHRVIAMPPCPLAWLPQQIAAPRRNQTNDSLEISGKACAARKIQKKRGVSLNGVHPK
jgi:hypothetical protein